jgi:hypothetical protein
LSDLQLSRIQGTDVDDVTHPSLGRRARNSVAQCKTGPPSGSLKRATVPDDDRCRGTRLGDRLGGDLRADPVRVTDGEK